MGLLGKLFGSSQTDVPDGAWLANERNGEWIEVLDEIAGGQTLELKEDSCYTDTSGNAFCILRSENPANNNFAYLGCFIQRNSNDAIYILVDRVESKNGAVLKKDDWSNTRQMIEKNVPELGSVIGRVRNIAAFSGYSTSPPYVFYLIKYGLKTS